MIRPFYDWKRCRVIDRIESGIEEDDPLKDHNRIDI